MRAYRTLVCLVLSTFAFSIFGCSPSELAALGIIRDPASELPKIPADKSLLKIKMRDFPLDGNEISKVIIDVQEVQFINAAGEKFIVSRSPIEVDLLTLVNNVTLEIGHAILPMGLYSQVRFLAERLAIGL